MILLRDAEPFSLRARASELALVRIHISNIWGVR